MTRGKEVLHKGLVEHVRRYLWGAAEEEEEDADGRGGDDGDGFISPCRCSGSMAWVHKSCLRIWRNRSPRRDSFYRCEQCFTEYRFRQTRLAQILSHVWSMRLFTVLMLAASFMGAMMMATLVVPGVCDDDRQMYFGANSGGGAMINVDGSIFAVVNKAGRWTGPTGVFTDSRSTAAAMTAPPDPYQKRPTGHASSRGTAHSTISYLNVAYWLSGHSLDEHEDARNDFFSAISDLSPSLRLVTAALILLAIFAFLRDGGQLDCLQATLLLVSMVMWCVAGWTWVLWLVPMPTLLGLWRFGAACAETVEIMVDTLVKQTASELDDFSRGPVEAPNVNNH